MGLFHDLGVSHLAVHTLLAGVAEKRQKGEDWSQLLLENNEDAKDLELFGYSRVLRLNTNLAHMSEADYFRFAFVSRVVSKYVFFYDVANFRP